MTWARDNSGDDWAYALRLANKGNTVEQITAALSVVPTGNRKVPGSYKFMATLQKRGAEAAHRYAERTARKAVEYVAANPMILDRSAALVELVKIESLAEGLPWGTYVGSRARRVLEAAFAVAEDLGSVRFGLALRQWSELAGVGFDAVRTERDWLIRLGWLWRNPHDRGGRTARYRLQAPSHIQLTPVVRCECGTVPLAHDAFRESALGSDGWYVLHRAAAAPLGVELLQARTGIDPEALMWIIGSLEAAGGVTVGDSGVVTCSPNLIPALDEIAARAGTLGAGEQDRARHAAEREAFRARGGVNVGVPE